jgi:DNA mismatch endonuclease (patch repair protein)
MNAGKSDDIPVSEARSFLMSRVKRSHTAPELAVRSSLRELGFKYSLHRKSLPGRPDLCLARYGLVIFVHGCFWHRHAGCPKATTPKTRHAFWQAKFEANTARDRKNARDLRKMGWSVAVVWECQCKPDKLRDKLSTIIAKAASRVRR